MRQAEVYFARRPRPKLANSLGPNQRQYLSCVCVRPPESTQRRFRFRAAKGTPTRISLGGLKPRHFYMPSAATESIRRAAPRPQVAHHSRSALRRSRRCAKPPRVTAERPRQRRRASRVRAARRIAHAATRKRRSPRCGSALRGARRAFNAPPAARRRARAHTPSPHLYAATAPRDRPHAAAGTRTPHTRTPRCRRAA